MTSHKAQIQALIADIDGLLAKRGNQLSRVLSSQAQEQRRVLERIRNFLARLEQTEATDETSLEISPLFENASQDQNLQGVEQLSSQLSQLLRPLQANIEALLQQREALVQEIRQLEQRRLHDYSLAQQQANQQHIISEFLQVLMNRLQESLTEQLAETVVSLQSQQFLDTEVASSRPVSANRNNSQTSSPDQSLLQPLEPVEQLQLLHQQLDQRLLALDTTVNVVFDALQRNVLSYQESLSQALEKMHSTGVQGEQLLGSFVNSVRQQLQPPMQSPSYPPYETTQGVEPKTLFVSPPTQADTSYQQPNLKLPYAGVEIQQSELGQQAALSALGITSNPPTTEGNVQTNENLPGLNLSELDLGGFDESNQPAIPLDINYKQEDITLNQPPQETEAEISDDISTPPDLDLVLEQLGEDWQNQPELVTSSAQLSQDSSQPIRDEVDELYESLFGNDNLTTERQDIAAIASLPVTPVTDETEQADSNAVIEEALLAGFDEPALEQAPELLSPPWENFLFDENAEIAAQAGDGDLQEVAAETPPSTMAASFQIEEPASADTIMALTDLLEDLGDHEELTELPPVAQEQAESTSEVLTASELSVAADSVELLAEDPTPVATPTDSDELFTEDTTPVATSADSDELFTEDTTPAATSADAVELLAVVQTTEETTESELPQTDNIGQEVEVDSTTVTTEEQVSEPASFDTPPAEPKDESRSDLTSIQETNLTNPQPQNSTDETSNSVSESYIPASANENLLATEELGVEQLPDILLDDQTLQQLDEDLANLERQVNSELQLPATEEPPVFPSTFLESQNSQFEPSIEAPTPPTASEDAAPLDQTIAEISISPPISDAAVETFRRNTSTQPEALAESPEDTEEKKNGVTTLWQTEDGRLKIEEVIPPTSVFGLHSQETWYLGIDLGTSGISAVLLNRSSCEMYPLYWSAEDQPGATSLKRSFRLPAMAYLPAAELPYGKQNSKAAEACEPEKVQGQLDTISAVADLASYNVSSVRLKPYLQVGIPYKSAATRKSEPILQINQLSTVPLIWVRRTLSKLLSTLNSAHGSVNPGLTVGANGLDPQTLDSIISQIRGVIFSCPSSWTEQYRFNVREALLASKLVSHPDQVFFVEEAIATVLSELQPANDEPVRISGEPSVPGTNHSLGRLLGNTLVINAGATATEMALVDLPDNLHRLAHSDFTLHSFAYAGNAIDQDIICQLLYPQKWRKLRPWKSGDTASSMNDPWNWQPAFPGLDEMRWDSLELDKLDLPRPGEPDLLSRIRLQQRLESTLLGQALMEAAIALKLILQHQESYTLELADQRWVLHRRDLERLVFVPFVQRLNRELNRLLVAKGIPTAAINQAICTGGTASLNAIARWLRQKLPNATIIQDVYRGESGSIGCSRVAYGLAVLPLHPQVLEIPKQQYTDYFLFAELLRILPERPISFGEIIQLLEERGINTRACQQRLLAFLEGELPPGLIPNDVDAGWLTQASRENTDYQEIAAFPLFEKQANLIYCPNFQQLDCLRRYLNAIVAGTNQSLEEPYTVNFAWSVASEVARF